jgi:two-component system, NarL family, nitrate/nitrite response regulator NarL
MRVVLVGGERDRGRLHPDLAASAIEVVGEFPTLAAAHAAGTAADAFVVAASALNTNGAGDEEDGIREKLTPRETEVLELLAEGLPNRAIADRLAISEQTVKFHVSSISGKLGAANRTDAVRRGVRRGLITL